MVPYMKFIPRETISPETPERLCFPPEASILWKTFPALRGNRPLGRHSKAVAGPSGRSAGQFPSHGGGHCANLFDQRLVFRNGELLGRVAHGDLRLRMHFDNQAVRPAAIPARDRLSM